MEIHKPYQCLPVGSFLAPSGEIGVSWHVFDDHVCVNENVIMAEDPFRSIYSFTMKHRHVGQLRLLVMKNGEYPIEGYHYERVDNTGYVGFNLSKLREDKDNGTL